MKKLNIWKILANVVMVLFIIGGIMGILKVIFKSDYLSFRYLLGNGVSFHVAHMPIYAEIYGVIMAIAEIISGVLFFIKARLRYTFIFVTLGVNMAVCLGMGLVGDLASYSSFVIRIAAVFIMIKSSRTLQHFN